MKETLWLTSAGFVQDVVCVCILWIPSARWWVYRNFQESVPRQSVTIAHNFKTAIDTSTSDNSLW